MSVRLSVCLSVTSCSSTKTAKPMITQTTPYDSSGTLVTGANLDEISTGSQPTGAPTEVV